MRYIDIPPHGCEDWSRDAIDIMYIDKKCFLCTDLRDTRMSLCEIFRMKIQTGGEQSRSRDSAVRYARKNDTAARTSKIKMLKLAQFRWRIVTEFCCLPRQQFAAVPLSIFIIAVCFWIWSVVQSEARTSAGFIVPTRNYHLAAVGSYVPPKCRFFREIRAKVGENCLTIFLENYNRIWSFQFW